jgi:putative spermidine/putrescine transport system substrate-binding protein
MTARSSLEEWMKLSRRQMTLALLAAVPATGLACSSPAPASPTAAPEAPTAAPAPTTPPAPTAAPTTATTAAPTAAPAAAATPAASAANMDTLIAAAKQEGNLSPIALPRDWLNYGDLMDGFSKKYGIAINDLNPNAGSGDEVEAIKANKTNKGPQAPDTIDVGYSFGPQAKSQDLLAAYKVSTWDTIPDTLKDADGYWYGDYYGVLSFEVNSTVVKAVPQDWSDLLKSDYKGQVALAGDPRTSNQAIQAVFAAGLANGGSADNAQPGLDFFAKLGQAGNLVPVIATQGTIAKGETPIVIRWDYLALADRDSLKGNPDITVVVPKSGLLGGVYVQAISAFAPHPNASKLWMEYLYSDDGQLTWLKAYGHPARYLDLVKRNVVPADLAQKLPSADLYAKALFPTLDQLTGAAKTITGGWDKTVNVNVK